MKISRSKWYERLGHVPRRGQSLLDQAADQGFRYLAFFGFPRSGKSFGAARHAESLLLEPDRHVWIVAPCVDETTEALTKRGWLPYHDLQVGDELLTLNTQGLAEWQPCSKVNTYTGEHEMVHIKQRNHDSVTTPHHRWLVGYTGSRHPNPHGRRLLGYRFTTTDAMTKPNEFVLCGAPVANLPTEPTHSDAFVELVGWYWTEGTNQALGNGILITQNRGPNSDRIRTAATQLFGPASTASEMRNTRKPGIPKWSDWKPGTPATCGNFGFNSAAGERFRRVAPNKVVSPEFITSLTKEQLDLFIETSIRADGHERRKNGFRERVVVQKCRYRLSALQMACQLAGYQTNIVTRGELWTLYIYERNHIWLGQKPQLKNRTRLWVSGTIWCPTTPNGTWLARRNGTVYFTGNTYQLGSKEFGYIWTDMAEQGFLQQADRRNFDIRGGNMRISWPWGSFVEVISADNPTSLRAEELDLLILAEASELPGDIFDRHLFARVEKRKGRVLIPTTPHGYNWIYNRFRVPSLRPGHPALGGRDNLLYDPLFWSVVVSADPELGDIYEPGVYDLDYIARAKRTLPAPVYKEQVGGDFASYAGLIYPYDQRLHVCDPFSIPDWWTHVVGWDHGANAPTAIYPCSYAPDGTLHVWGEIYTVGKSAAEYARMLRTLLAGKSPSAISVDPSMKQVRIELGQPGVDLITTIPHDKNIQARIIRLTELMRLGKFKIHRGKCPNLEREIQAWEWDEDNPGKPRLHQECHGLDAIGYASLASVPLPTVPTPDNNTFALPGEDQRTSELWRGVREQAKIAEDIEEFNVVASAFEDDPFEEVGRPQGYEVTW